MTDKFTNFATPVCAAWLNQVDRTTFVALGSANTVDEAREVLGVVGWTIDANVTLHVAVNGDDATGDGSATAPWATLAQAFRYLVPAAIAPGVAVTIQLGAGDFDWNGPLTFSHPYGGQIFVAGVAPTAAITGVVQADFTTPLTPVPGTRGAYDLFNSAGMLATNANATARQDARAVDEPLNLALLRSVYPTRIVPTTASFALSARSSLGGLQDILFVNGSLSSVAGGDVRIGTSLAFALDSLALSVLTGPAVLVSVGGIIIASSLIVSRTGVGIRVDGGTMTVNSAFIQGSGGTGINVRLGGFLTIAEVIASGNSNQGIATTSGASILVNSDGTLKKEMSFSGNGSQGVFLDGGSLFGWGTGGGGNFLRSHGNSAEQISLVGGSMVAINQAGSTLSAQGSTTIASIIAGANSSITSTGAVTVNAGTVAIQAFNGSTIMLAGAVTITDSPTPVLQRPFMARAGTIRITGALTVPASLGTAGVLADRGGRVNETGSVLLGLNATVPNRFTPPLGQLAADGAWITSGPATTAALVMLSTGVTINGSTVRLAALAGTGTRNVQVQADGTLVAV